MNATILIDRQSKIQTEDNINVDVTVAAQLFNQQYQIKKKVLNS